MTDSQRRQIKGALLKCAKENENKITPTCYVIISEVCKAGVERIEELEKQVASLTDTLKAIATDTNEHITHNVAQNELDKWEE
jgi:hypothetical protein